MQVSVDKNLFVLDNKKLPESRNNNFNFLRLLFAALVLVSHASEMRYGNRNHELLTRIFGSISFGDLAVDGFFLLSGYLIITSWIRQPQLSGFLEKRLRRIVPGFFAAFLVSVIILGPFGARDITRYFAGLNYFLLIKLAFQLRPPEVSGIFIGQPYPALNGAMWSICYEFRCYLIVALIGLIGAKRQKAVWLVLLLATLGLSLFPEVCSKIKFPGIWQLLGDPLTFVRLLAFFSAGACFSLFQPAIPLFKQVAALAFIAVIVGLFNPTITTLILSTAGAYALFWFVFAQVPSLKGFQHINDISYGVYLYGWPIQKILEWHFPAAPLWVLVPVALAICAGLGYVSWQLVELPWLRKTPRITAAN